MALRRLEVWKMDTHREKILLHGEASLSDEELLALILEGRRGPGQREASEMAAAIVDQCGDLGTIRRASAAGLSALPIQGMTLSQACTVAAALELGARCQSPRQGRFAVTGPASVFEYYAPRLSHLSHERFHVMCLDARHTLLRDALAAVGGASSCTIEPREALVEAVRLQCEAVIFVHNHPSGDPTPSEADMAVTIRLKRACELLGISPLDHVIIGEGQWISMADTGQFQNL